MFKPYLILVNNVLWDRKLTKHFAEKVAQELRDKGVMNVSVGYDITGGTHDSATYQAKGA